MQDIRQQIAAVLAKYPTLNHFGFGAHNERKLSAEERQREIANGQQDLYTKSDEVAFVIEWLSDVEKTKTINRKCGSYRLKHVAERTPPGRYISNGSFITAAIIAGFNVEQNGPNAWFNMSRKSLKRKEQR